jgi:hypothetical protein
LRGASRQRACSNAAAVSASCRASRGGAARPD